MNCLTCASKPAPGGVRITDITAVAVCTRCGAGVCADHLRRSDADGSVVCADCAIAPTSIKRKTA